MKRLYTVLLFAFIFVTMAARAELVFNIGGTGDDHGTGIAVDSKGNYVAVGYFRGTVDFDPTELINEKTALANPADPEASDIYVAKYDTKGKLAWVFTIGSGGPNRPSSVYIDDQDYIYITGYFSGKANFNPSTGTTILDAGQGRNVFVAKYTPDAKLEWAIGYGDNETAPYAQNDSRYDEGFDVAVDPDGRVYVTGAFGGKIDLDPSDGEDAQDTYTSKMGADNKPSRDAFVACYDTSGSFIWGYAIGGPGTDEGHAIKTGFDGSVYVAGMFSNTVNFDPHGGTSNLTSAGSTDAFLFKLDILQNLAWAERWGSTGPDQVMPGALINYFDESLTVGGQFSGTVDFDPSAGTKNITSNGAGDAFIAFFDTDGKLLNALGFGGPGDDAVSKVALNITGDNAYATGWFQGTADFDPNPISTFNLKANSNSSDAFIIKISSPGIFEWAHNFGSAETDPAKTQMGSGIALNEYDNPVITGRFTGTANFATNGDSYTLTSNGGFDSFIALYDQDGYLWMDQNPDNVTITSPNGGETWDAGTTHDITWQANFTKNVKIEYTTDGGINWIEINSSIAASAGKLTWTVPNTPTTQAKIMITELSNEDVSDESDNPFTIKSSAPNPHITVVYPNGQEVFHRSQNEIIRWTSNDVANVKLEFSIDNGTNWTTIIEATPAAAGAYEWNVPDIGIDQSTQALVRISDQVDSKVFDMSDAPFTIINTNGVDDMAGSNLFNLQVNPDPATVNATITFNTSRAGNVSLDLISTSGATVKTISQGMMPDGSHRIELSVNGLESGVYFLRLVSGGDVVVRKMAVVK